MLLRTLCPTPAGGGSGLLEAPRGRGRGSAGGAGLRAGLGSGRGGVRTVAATSRRRGRGSAEGRGSGRGGVRAVAATSPTPGAGLSGKGPAEQDRWAAVSPGLVGGGQTD